MGKYESYDADFEIIKNFVFSEGSSDNNKVEGAVSGSVRKNDGESALHVPYCTKDPKVKTILEDPDVYLVDVQHIYSIDRILYIYIKDGKKHTMLDSTYTYFYALKSEEEKITFIKDLDKVYRVDIPSYYRMKEQLPIYQATYESDVPTNVKRSSAYYRDKEETQNYDLHYAVIDIECPTPDNTFPQPSIAPVPIVSICIFDSETKQNLALVLEPDSSKVEEAEDIIICANEKDLLNKFCNALNNINPIVITGWNVLGFDMEYIVNRMKINNIPLTTLSLAPRAKVYSDSESCRAQFPGYIILDYLFLYRDVMGNKLPSFSLDNVSAHELNQKKLHYDGTLWELYTTDVNKFIKYNMVDVELVAKLDDKLKYINLSNELRRLTGTTWDTCLSSSGLCDGLVVNYLHDKNIVAATRGAVPLGKKQSLIGAFVKQPDAAIFRWLIDFDAASMYPNLIRSFNLGPETYFCRIKPDVAKDYIYDKEEFRNTGNIDLILDPLYQKIPSKISTGEFEQIIDDEKLMVAINGCCYKRPDSDVGKGFLSTIMEDLINRRNASSIINMTPMIQTVLLITV